MTRRVLAVVCLLTLSACAPAVNSMRLDATERPPTDPASVVALLEAPAAPHKAIAVVQVSSHELGTFTLDELKAVMVKRAAALGGDAVILQIGTKTVAGGVPSTVGVLPYYQQTASLSGTVIVYTR